VATTLPHLKRLAGILVQSIAQHESVFGTIEIDPIQRMSPEAREYVKQFEGGNKNAK
jgi:hypothetical protein